MAATNLERQQSVLNLLQKFEGAEPLKQLFWSELNYDRVSRSLSRRGWKESVAGLLAEDPVLLASGADDFHVIYGRLASDKLVMGDERPVVNKLLQEHPYTLFVFSNSKQERFHFLNVKYDDDVQKRRIFRRITVGPNERLRTASERIALLDLEDIRPDLFGLSPLAIQQRHDEAFDVEPVTKEFFSEYRRIFEEVEEAITGFGRDKDRKRLYTQRLFNRLMFIAFIQKKGWMKVNGDSDYLPALWKAHLKDNAVSDKNFYRDRLKPLFFFGLNGANEIDLMNSNRGSFMKTLIGNVPYLNGGLFEEDEDDKNSEIKVPDKAINAVLSGLFAKFNFTVTESTPLDIEVAVDPEMLGKIFEELVTGRHETGSYYTPKPIVSFMCREALKGYLEAAAPGETRAAIERFVERHESEELRNAEAILDTLRRVNVCDPACGSGAYLLGMLHELLDLRAALFQSRRLDAKSVYDRKLEIIQTNIYGVDIDPFAVNIARLRLWLSLAIDFEGAKPEPLPNLDYKVEIGDSLLGPNPSGGLEMGFRKQLIDDFLKSKAEYLTAHYSQKKELKKKIEKLKADIASFGGHNKSKGFDWAVEFAEVFVDSGFDAILANPPYVRADAQFRHIENARDRAAAVAQWKEYRSTLLESGMYSTLYEKWDLYVPFLERAYQSLRSGGSMVFIIPDAYNAAKYAKKSHELFLKRSRIERVDFCSEIPIFDAGVNNTILHFAKAEPTATNKPIRARRSGEDCTEFDSNVEYLATKHQSAFGPELFRSDWEEPAYRNDNAVPLGNICYISYGLRANSNDLYWKGEFVTEDLVSDTRDKKHSKPFIEGKDLVRWWIKRVRYLEWGTQRAPKKFARPTFPELHEAKEKIIALVVASDGPPAVFDDAQRFTTHTSCIFVPWHQLRGVRNRSIQKTARYQSELKSTEVNTILREELESRSAQFALKYVLAVMNSRVAAHWLAAKRRSKIHVYPDDWKSLPIKSLPMKDQAQFVSLVDKILAEYHRHGYPLPISAAKRVLELECEIEGRLSVLYGTQAEGASALR